jgi:hypothetical protein
MDHRSSEPEIVEEIQIRNQKSELHPKKST